MWTLQLFSVIIIPLSNASCKLLQIEVIHEFHEKSPLWLLHRLHQPKSVKQPNRKAKTILQKIKVGGCSRDVSYWFMLKLVHSLNLRFNRSPLYQLYP